jgi:hypothetical protein
LILAGSRLRSLKQCQPASGSSATHSKALPCVALGAAPKPVAKLAALCNTVAKQREENSTMNAAAHQFAQPFLVSSQQFYFL